MCERWRNDARRLRSDEGGTKEERRRGEGGATGGQIRVEEELKRGEGEPEES